MDSEKEIFTDLGIWENTYCLQCGACCYDFCHKRLCKQQEIENRKSYCKIHNDGKWEVCKDFFCNMLPENSKGTYRGYAKLIRTVPEGKEHMVSDPCFNP